MIIVTTEIVIDAPIEQCFDLARSIDVHTQTVWKHTKERAVSGRTQGMIEAGETVTFEAVHFLVRQQLTSRITEMDKPFRFVDQMVKGAFKSMRHEHDFIALDEGRTLMRDTLRFEAPLSVLGWIAERAVLRSYMRRFLEDRNLQLKRIAEGAGK